ncbi:collagen-like protein [Pricia sp.]|uniref:collagen-like triple helix repeat-containing protein n=1 Tax=Pricia sp. TaxID=2268138 RepID=UPI003594726D
MKNIAVVFGAFLTLFFVSCEGDPGPPGFDGLDGPQGPAGPAAGQVIDIFGDFAADSNYGFFYSFQDDGIEVLETDVVLVYLSFDQVEDNNGEPVDIWRLLPQTRLLDQGILQYNYEHDFFRVDIFLESDFDLSTLEPGDTDNQKFRIAILPADFVQTAKLDKSNIGSVMSSLGISEKDVPKIRTN